MEVQVLKFIFAALFLTLGIVLGVLISDVRLKKRLSKMAIGTLVIDDVDGSNIPERIVIDVSPEYIPLDDYVTIKTEALSKTNSSYNESIDN